MMIKAKSNNLVSRHLYLTFIVMMALMIGLVPCVQKQASKVWLTKAPANHRDDPDDGFAENKFLEKKAVGFQPQSPHHAMA